MRAAMPLMMSRLHCAVERAVRLDCARAPAAALSLVPGKPV
jgi:hypothetical protein